MPPMHLRNPSVSTALETRPQSSHAGDELFTRSRTPVGHGRIRSIGSTEKGDDSELVRPLLLERVNSVVEKELFKVPVARGRRLVANKPTATFLWIASLIASSLFTYLCTRHGSRPINPLGSFQSGYVTELRDARSMIRIRKQHFTGSLDFKDHHGFIPKDSPSLRYIGNTPDIDAAWDELTKDRYFLLTDAEARDAYGNSPLKYWNVHHGGYVAGLDVLHTLHCLNHLRQSLYPQTYPQDPEHSVMHKAHCVDHIRQLTMCHADLTPVPTQFFFGLERNYINSSREHTCRDFSQIRAWATERFNGSNAVQPRNRDGTERTQYYAPWGP